MPKTARDIMTHGVLSTTPSATAQEVLRLLAQHHISGMPVISEPKEGEIQLSQTVVGIITEADLLDTRPEAKVGDLMTTKVICVRPETPVREVAKILAARGIKRVPVMGPAGNLVGIVSRADIVAAFAAGE